MKTFSTHINEGLTIPTFIHPQLNKPNDPDGKFWKLLELANTENEKSSRKTYSKVQRMANDLYQELSLMAPDENVSKAMEKVSDAVTFLAAGAVDVPDDLSQHDIKYLRNVLFLIQGIDARLSRHRWYKGATIDIKAGYIPLRGSEKDQKIKYRVLVKTTSPISTQTKKSINRDVMTMSPMHKNFIAGIQWNKDDTMFSILITNTEGYKK